MSNDEAPKKSLRDIAARAKEARNLSPTVTSAQDLIGAMQARPSSPPPSAPPGSLSGRPSAPPPSAPPGSLPARPSAPPGSLSGRPSAPPGSLPARPSGLPERPSAPAPENRASLPPVAAPSPAVAAAPESAPASASPPTHPAGIPLPEKKGEVAAKPTEEQQKSVTPILIGVALVAALGIGVVMTRKPEGPVATPVVAAATSAPEIKAEVKPEPSAAPVVTAAPAESGVVDINALSAADPSSKAAPRASGPLAKASEKAPDAPPPVTSEPVASAAPRVMGSVGELHDEMRKRVGATEQGEQAAATGPTGDPNAKQEKPSKAAVSGALGAVRGAVKACIADTETPTRINVTFQSDGSVKSVVVSGGAAGKAAEACVQAAVKKARVAPFMDASFSTSFSVSP